MSIHPNNPNQRFTSCRRKWKWQLDNAAPRSDRGRELMKKLRSYMRCPTCFFTLLNPKSAHLGRDVHTTYFTCRNCQADIKVEVTITQPSPIPVDKLRLNLPGKPETYDKNGNKIPLDSKAR